MTHISYELSYYDPPMKSFEFFTLMYWRSLELKENQIPTQSSEHF
jgi:hypothetical protein